MDFEGRQSGGVVLLNADLKAVEEKAVTNSSIYAPDLSEGQQHLDVLARLAPSQNSSVHLVISSFQVGPVFGQE